MSGITPVSGATPESFTFDGATNITGRTGPSASYTIDGANRVTSDGTRSFSWDGADRLIQRGVDSFGYDGLARLTTSTVAGTTRSYASTGDGLLSSRTEGTATTSFLWDASTAPAPLLVAGTDRIVYGLGPLYMALADGATLALARDALGSVRAEVTDAGVIAKAFRYAAYGQIVQPIVNTPTLLGFTGELRDPSGLMYLRARWYDPTTGRFLTRDSVGGAIRDPVSLNLYAYARGRPSLLVDPRGTEPASAAESARSYILPDYLRMTVVIDPFHVGWGGSFTLALDRYGNVFMTPVGLFVQRPDAETNTGMSALPVGVTLTAGWIAGAGAANAQTTTTFLTGPSYSACAAAISAICDTLSPGAPGISKFAVEAGLGTPDASFASGWAQLFFTLPIGW